LSTRPESVVPAPKNPWRSTLASLLVGAGFFALWFWLLPQWLGFQVEAAGAAHSRWVAAIPSVLGFAVARCIWDFGWTGRGTPVPVLPPPNLMVVGWYRYMRNPMYVGFAIGWIGRWIVFGRASLAAIIAVMAVALGIHLFVRLYEEPTLRRKFGADYERVLPQCPALMAAFAAMDAVNLMMSWCCLR